MACDECRDLTTHTFRSQDDLVHAFQVAALEMDRGVLERVSTADREVREDEALRSAISAGAFPGSVVYRFKCTVCGDQFALDADMENARGSWTRVEAGG